MVGIRAHKGSLLLALRQRPPQRNQQLALSKLGQMSPATSSSMDPKLPMTKQESLDPKVASGEREAISAL